MRLATDLERLAPDFHKARRFPLAFVVLATEDRRQGNPVDYRGLKLAESLLRPVSSQDICAILEV